MNGNESILDGLLEIQEVLNKTSAEFGKEDLTALHAAVKAFHDENVSCLPIVNTHNQPVGIVTWRDIINWLYGKVNTL